MDEYLYWSTPVCHCFYNYGITQKQKSHLAKQKTIKQIQIELRDLDAKRKDGKFVSTEGKVYKNQIPLIGLLDECFEDAHEIITSKFQVKDDLKPIFERLISMKEQLSNLYITRRWTMRETDL